ncbi:uncharacterized protein TRAVEDRAFT_54686 [Trametes versicolor FP-101664 SS1]|uniref:Putative ER transporter 6TM N-terminal domain-containing protein n=1 Tax=Trametes versicolor (strain FP-101664) TaxID=717944 RepID=R7S8K7_TRAVS|nr:uncharacterized protein TRAVEDRAFT_54686 [Trametes versicolor FP-101664 SS1]EIW51294.1 hypothetical protein TRAVEDRAFT_54686 [Trametes versicolor FP-101664 SS1]
MLTSVACYIAIALVFITFAFPETLNHSYLASSAELLGKFQGILAMQEEVLRTDPHDIVTGTPLATKTAMARTGMIMQLQQLMGQKQFLNLEFSWGRWNGDDIKDMLEPLQIIATRLGALNGFAKIMGHPLSLADHKHEDTESVSEAQSDASGTAVDDTFLLRQFRERNLAAEEEHGVRLIDVLPNIRDATTELRAAGVATLASIQALIVAVNTHRYKRGNALQSTRLAELDTSLTALRAAIADFKADRRFVLLQPYQAVFEKHDAGAVNRIPLRALYQSYVFASNLAVVCTGIVQLAELASQTAAKRTRARLWAPKGLRAIVKLLRTPNGPGEGAVGEDVQPEQAEGRAAGYRSRVPDLEEGYGDI